MAELHENLWRGRSKGRKKLREQVRRALGGDHIRLLAALNLVASVPPLGANALLAARRIPLVGAEFESRPLSPELARALYLVDQVALALIRERGDRSKATPDLEEALEALFQPTEAPFGSSDLRDGATLLIGLWSAPEEWLRRLRHCDYVPCEHPYFLDRSSNRASRFCSKKHGTYGARDMQRFDRIFDHRVEGDHAAVPPRRTSVAAPGVKRPRKGARQTAPRAD